MAIYSRVMLKISGEALGGSTGRGFDRTAIDHIANEIREVAAAGVEIAIVAGGGNFLRGQECQSLGFERGTADYMGMTATILNAMALQSAIEAVGYPTRVLSAIEARQVCEPFIRRRALRHMEKGRVVILAGGTGNPGCTTDTAAALRAVELGCKVMLKATQVDGIYTSDPKTNPNALRYQHISYAQAINENLRVMDATAFTVCREHRMPLVVYSIAQPGSTLRAATGKAIGTLVDDSPGDSR